MTLSENSPGLFFGQRLKEYVSDQPQFVFFSGHGIAPSGWVPLASLQQHVGLHERVVSSESQIEILRRDRDNLETQNQLLQSRVAELRRTAARETQRYDQLLVEHAELQKRLEKMIDCLNERARANDCLQSILISRMRSHLRMTESYEGVVEDKYDNTVVVVYEVNGRIIEQTYERGQFLDGRLPDVGTRLVAYVHLASIRDESVEPGNGKEEIETRDESATTRRRSLREPLEF